MIKIYSALLNPGLSSIVPSAFFYMYWQINTCETSMLTPKTNGDV